MKLLTSLLCLLATLTASAAENPELAILRAADDARVAAMKSVDRDKLAAQLSEDLHYAHSNGLVDTKASFIELITSGKAKYLRLDYESRDFTFPAPGIALMTGRFDVKAIMGETTTETKISFLGVWRQEAGRWKFLAWQTCKIPPATPAK